MKILNILLKEKINEGDEFNPVYIDGSEIVVNFLDDSKETYTSLRIDGTDYPMIDLSDTVQMLQFLCDLRDYLDEMDDTTVFGDEDTFIRTTDIIDSNIRYIKEECVGDTQDQSEDDEDKFRIINSMNMVAGIPFSSVNWDNNAENLEDIEGAMDMMHQQIADMMSGEIDFTEVLDTAEQVLGMIGMPTDYNFPNIQNVSRREVAILKMFDAFAVYAKLFAYTGVYRTRKEVLEQFQDTISQLTPNNTDDDVSDVYEASEAINNERYDEE